MKWILLAIALGAAGYYYYTGSVSGASPATTKYYETMRGEAK